MIKSPIRTASALLALALCLGLAACASLSEDACRSGDWYSIGARDGADGRLPGFLTNHAEACAQYGIGPDRAEWEAGRQRGLESYCTPLNVYEVGKRGRSLSPVCEGPGVERLVEAHGVGRAYWRLEQRIDRLERDIGELRREALSLGEDETSRRTSLRLEALLLRNRILLLQSEQRRYSRLPKV